jgi:hypothetical protein
MLATYRVVMQEKVNGQTMTFAIFVEATSSQHAQALAEAEFPEASIHPLEPPKWR